MFLEKEIGQVSLDMWLIWRFHFPRPQEGLGQTAK